MGDETVDAKQTWNADLRKLRLEEYRFYAELAKWIAVAIGAIVTFLVIDRGKLDVEKFRSHSEDRRALLQSYLAATEAVQPDVWRRKLSVLRTLPEDEHIRQWAAEQLKELDEFGERKALFRETVRIASQLVDRSTLADSSRKAARSRYEQLYWADLPFVREETEVEGAMVQFRQALLQAEAAPQNQDLWNALSLKMLNLARVLDVATHSAETVAK